MDSPTTPNPCPAGTKENSPALQCWVGCRRAASPVRDGRNVDVGLSSLAGLVSDQRQPSAEALGYFRSSRWDFATGHPALRTWPRPKRFAAWQETEMRPHANPTEKRVRQNLTAGIRFPHEPRWAAKFAGNLLLSESAHATAYGSYQMPRVQAQGFRPRSELSIMWLSLDTFVVRAGGSAGRDTTAARAANATAATN